LRDLDSVCKVVHRFVRRFTVAARAKAAPQMTKRIVSLTELAPTASRQARIEARPDYELTAPPHI
jgi:hypothetical protein